MTATRPVFAGSLLVRLLLPALLVCAPLAALAQQQTQAPVPVTSVASVDLARYSGQWFEIAAFPMFFQRNCVGDTTAAYSLRDDGAIQVVNRCRTDSGFDEATGKASVVEGFANSRLKVSFFWPFKADYWVLGLDPEYRWALVGLPKKNGKTSQAVC